MKVINLWAGPGAGKSTTAAGLFFAMKVMNPKVELVTEYAKELTYAKKWDRLRDQTHVARVQASRQRILRGQVDWIVTDSPLPLSLHYGRVDHTDLLGAWVLAEFDTYENFNFFVARAKPYQPYGRRQSEASARRVDEDLARLMDQLKLDGITVTGDEDAPNMILHYLKQKGHL